jgi:hypothetical protein
MQEILHSLTIEQQKNIAVTGVESVVAFSESQIALLLSGGGKLYIFGSGLKITGFSKSSGTFTASGNASGARYGGKGVKGFFK